MESLFPAVPEDLTALGDEELNDLLASFQDTSRRLRAGEIDLGEHYADLNETERSERVMEEWREAATIVQSIRSIQEERVQAEASFAEEAAEIDALFGNEEALAATAEEDEDKEDEKEDEEPEGDLAADAPAEVPAAEAPAEDAVEETEALAASVPAKRSVRYPAVARSHRAPDSPRAGTASMVASMGSRSVKSGDDLTSESYAVLAAETMKRLGKPQHIEGGGREFIRLASADIPFPEEFTLVQGDNDGNLAKLRAVGSPWLGVEGLRSLAASGGICAPPTPFYDVPTFSTTQRPVRDSLASFRSDRGGVSVPSVGDLNDADGAISIIEVEDDAAGGSAATKSCLPMDCAEWTDTFIGAISHCREIGVFNARTWPEGVAKQNDDTMALHARTAEGRLLRNIDALSLDATSAAVYGASSSLVYALSVHRTSIISLLRMDPNTRFNVILPFWAETMFGLDSLFSSDGNRFSAPSLTEALNRAGFNTTFHLDEALEGDAEIWSAQVDGQASPDWPGAMIVARIAPAGHFVHLDGGTLELGLVRDSGLIHTNDYELFGETFENVFAVGPTQAARRVEITVCPNGTLAGLTTPFTCNPS